MCLFRHRLLQNNSLFKAIFYFFCMSVNAVSSDKKDLVIPYRIHSGDELQIFKSHFDKDYRNVWDVESFWIRTINEAESVAERIKDAGFLISDKENQSQLYHGAFYKVGSFSFIYPSSAPKDLLVIGVDPHPSKLGKLVYWQGGGFIEEPITVQYDLDIDSTQNFDEVVRLERFLKNSNLSFRVTPTLEQVAKIGADAQRLIQRATDYQRKHEESILGL